jgi:hypothetical protein
MSSSMGRRVFGVPLEQRLIVFRESKFQFALLISPYLIAITMNTISSRSQRERKVDHGIEMGRTVSLRSRVPG